MTEIIQVLDIILTIALFVITAGIVVALGIGTFILTQSGGLAVIIMVIATYLIGTTITNIVSKNWKEFLWTRQ